MLKINEVYCLNALDFLNQIDFDCDCFIDPIYNVKKDYGECKDNLTDKEYLDFMEKVLNLIKQKTLNSTIYIPKKYKFEFWEILGKEYQEIILSFSPAGAIRWNYSNQFNTLLTNFKPKRPIRNVWHNIREQSHGYFFKENTYNHPGYTSLELTRKVIQNLTDNNVIIDCFCGTGNTGIAAWENKKNYILCDIDNKWCDLSKDRLKIIKNNLFEGVNNE